MPVCMRAYVIAIYKSTDINNRIVAAIIKYIAINNNLEYNAGIN